MSLIAYTKQELHVRQDSAHKLEYTHDLYNIRAHQLHYSSLIADMIKSVEFIEETKNPVMAASPELKRECDNLLDAIKRLEQERKLQAERMQNIMHLVSLHRKNVYQNGSRLRGTFKVYNSVNVEQMKNND